MQTRNVAFSTKCFSIETPDPNLSNLSIFTVDLSWLCKFQINSFHEQGNKLRVKIMHL